jgi:hypothetical protein
MDLLQLCFESLSGYNVIPAFLQCTLFLKLQRLTHKAHALTFLKKFFIILARTTFTVRTKFLLCFI